MKTQKRRRQGQVGSMIASNSLWCRHRKVHPTIQQAGGRGKLKYWHCVENCVL